MSRETKLEHLKSFFSELRDVDSDFTPQAVELLLWVALANESQSMTELAKKCGYTLSGVSKTVVRLGEKINGVEGLGLVRSDYDAGNYRQKIIRLTPKGERFIERLISYL